MVTEISDYGWRRRYEDIRGMIRLKWILIMLKTYQEDDLKEEQWFKVIDYYAKTQPQSW